MVTLGDGRYTRTVDLQFHMVPCKSTNICILGRSFVATLEVMASPIYFKLKYHNVQDESMTICVDLFGGKIIYNKALQHRQKKDKRKVVGMNIASVIAELIKMKIKPSVIKVNYYDRTTIGKTPDEVKVGHHVPYQGH